MLEQSKYNFNLGGKKIYLLYKTLWVTVFMMCEAMSIHYSTMHNSIHHSLFISLPFTNTCGVVWNVVGRQHQSIVPRTSTWFPSGSSWHLSCRQPSFSPRTCKSKQEIATNTNDLRGCPVYKFELLAFIILLFLCFSEPLWSVRFYWNSF